MKIGLIAGAGSLPSNVVAGATAQGHEITLIAIDGFANASEFSIPGNNYGLGEFGKITKTFKKAGCTHICFAGTIDRPDFSSLKPDFKTMLKLPGVIKAARHGDDNLLKYVLQTFENEGFSIISPQELCTGLLLGEGHLGAVKLSQNERDDAIKACKIAAEMGALDIGQGAVVCRGLVLAVEAQEGTDRMLTRVASLPDTIRGTENRRAGVLAKMVKPGQEKRVDLPTIGPATVDKAANAGLAGIVAEAGNAFVIDREIVVSKADAAGLFVVGLPPSKS